MNFTKMKENYLLIFFMLFIYFINLKLILFPYYLIIPFFVIGVIAFAYDIVSSKKITQWKFNFILACFLALVVTFFSSVNNGFDFSFYKENYLFPIVLFFSMFSICFFSKNKISYYKLCNIVGLTVVFQLSLSLISYISLPVFELFQKIFFTETLVDVGELRNERVVGLGKAFFGSGVLNSCILIYLALCINFYKNNNILILIYILIFALGMLSSRTTFVGFILSLGLILINFKGNLRFIILGFSSFITMFLIVSGFIFIPGLSGLIDFGFGFLKDYQDSQASTSVNLLFEMYGVLPNDFQTWLIGHNKYILDEHYYKNIDVGYTRIIFANGLLGLMVFLSTHIFLILSLNKKFFSYSFKIIMILLFLILNTKGVANILFFLFFLKFFYENYSSDLLRVK